MSEARLCVMPKCGKPVDHDKSVPICGACLDGVKGELDRSREIAKSATSVRCTSCGNEFTREHRRGRPHLRCRDCRHDSREEWHKSWLDRAPSELVAHQWPDAKTNRDVVRMRAAAHRSNKKAAHLKELRRRVQASRPSWEQPGGKFHVAE